PFKINYTTGEVLLWKNINEHTAALIIYGDPGELTETEITYKDKVKLLRIHGDITYRIEQAQKRIIINAQHGGSDSIFIVEPISGKRLVIVYTTKSRAEKTWVLDHTVIISNVYFIGEYRSDNKSLCIESELDIDSCGDFTILTPFKIDKVLIGGTLVEIEKITENIYKVTITQYMCKGMEARNYQADNAVLIEDPLWDKGRQIKPASPLEKNGYYENGIYVYKIKFDINKSVLSKLSNKILGLAGFSDYAVMTINGDYIASGYHYIEGDVDKSLREGINELTVILESTGHPNDGFLYVPNGIYTGIYLGKKQEFPLNTWYKIDAKLSIGPDFDFAEFLSNPKELMRILYNIDSYEKKLVNFIDTQGLFITEIRFNNPEHYYIFDPGGAFYYNHYYRILLFINDVYIGPVIGPIDITKYLKPGVNKIAMFVEWGVISPIIRIFEHKIDSEWYVQEGTKGLIDKWYQKPIDETSMETIPLMLRNLAGKVYWIKAKINYDKEPSGLHPVKLFVDSWGMRLGVFVNGQFIGRIGDDSAKKELYVPEPAIRKGTNDVTLFAIIASNNAGIGRIEFREVYEHKKKDICFYKET
ncbi:MAG: beta-galactosidase, partial [Staphylothermus sp.]|nr:beta-galactosidase [Staphylothermus sp.]